VPVCLLTIVAALMSTSAIPAQTVWSGYSFSFTKASFTDPLFAVNQDRITNNVWVTRGNNQGIYNIHDEVIYDELTHTSPAGTKWATYINNPTKNIAATNYSNLVFADWIPAYGGQGGMSLPTRLTGGPAVVHLVADNIYLDLQFTDWASNGGGGFSYNRSPAPVSVNPSGDYNANGVVDAADYVLWRNTSGQSGISPGTGADGNSSGAIDSGDYDYWRARFGNPAGSGSLAATGSSIPEPTSALLLIAGTIAHCLRRRVR
jgi:hypothetical protein